MKGSCLYGAVRFNVTGTPTDFDLCHCSRCREASGSAFLAELEFEGAEFEWVSGRSLVKTHGAPVRKIPPGYRRAFCTVSGSPVPIVDRAWFCPCRDRPSIRIPEFGRSGTSSSTSKPCGLRLSTPSASLSRNQNPVRRRFARQSRYRPVLYETVWFAARPQPCALGSP
jgi:hypothetical protein